MNAIPVVPANACRACFRTGGIHQIGTIFLCTECAGAVHATVEKTKKDHRATVRAADPKALFRPGGRTLADVWGLR